MRSTADVETVSKESSLLLTRATVNFLRLHNCQHFLINVLHFQELFIKQLASEGFKDNNKGKKIEYKNLANVVHKNERYEFLREIVPQKITVRQYRELMAKKQQNTNSSTSDKDTSSSDEDSDSDDKRTTSGLSKSSDSE